MELSDSQKAILTEQGHLLVEGGPGSGKTTVAIIKAESIIQKLVNRQHILFLSFSNPAVSRVIEAIGQSKLFTKEQAKQLEVQTYHAFFWQILKTHGYLIGLPRKIQILTTITESVALSPIRSVPGKKKLTVEEKQQRKKLADDELRRLAFEQGYIAFDLFAPLVSELFAKGEKVRDLLCNAYPYIFLDEFQDTNDQQWEVIKYLGKKSTLIALADPEQRIYDFAGAHPDRLNHYRQEFNPTPFTLGQTNHRSNGTDIALFGNDILTGRFRQSNYNGIELVTYQPNYNQAYTALRVQTLQARKRLLNAGKKDWSLAILVPTKKLMRIVSDNFRDGTEIYHTAAIDMEGAILAAELIALLMQPAMILGTRNDFIALLQSYYRGKGGGAPSNTDLNEAESIGKAYERIRIAEMKNSKIPSTKLDETLKTFEEIGRFRFSGNPKDDWIRVRTALAESQCKRLNQIAEDAKNIRLLERGTQLRDALAANWREYGSYMTALGIVRNAFVQDYFTTNSKPETGVIVMNMHKAKGKQFDEVIIFENWPITVRGEIKSNSDRIVRGNSREQDLTHARQNFRVSVTRAKSKTTILTCVNDPCVLLRAS